MEHLIQKVESMNGSIRYFYCNSILLVSSAISNVQLFVLVFLILFCFLCYFSRRWIQAAGDFSYNPENHLLQSHLILGVKFLATVVAADACMYPTPSAGD